MIVIVDHVTLKEEEGTKATVVKTAEGIEKDIEELLRCGLRMGLLRLLMTFQHSCINQRGFNKNQRSESMGDSSLQTNQYECTRRLYESAFNCNAEVHGMYLDKSRSAWGD